MMMPEMSATIQYDGELSGQAYLLLIVMVVIIVCGFSWCFFRAVTASNEEAAEQLPDDV